MAANKKAIVVGGSSGLGRALALLLAAKGYEVGVTARRLDLLESLREEAGPAVRIRQMDLADANEAARGMSQLIAEMGDVDLVVHCAAISIINKQLGWPAQVETIAVNVQGFAAIATVVMHHFIDQKRGHFVSISSTAALRGLPDQPEYAASKAFVSRYVDGLRHKVFKLGLPITITDIQPGFMDTRMANDDNVFWAAPPEKAAAQVYRAIRRKRKHAYVTRRWRLIAWFMKYAPDWLFHRVG